MNCCSAPAERTQRAALTRVSPRAAAVIAAVFALDRITKFLAHKYLDGTAGLDWGLLRLTYVENTGAAFSMLRGMNWLFAAVAAVFLGAMFFWREEIAACGRAARLGMLLIAGGALGNLWDRLSCGAVADFIDFRVWPVFNAADSFITVGAALMALAFYRGGEKRCAR
ncbi:MAG: signal peptidase II [Elusimicrobiales bacterium]